jgi:hypothetical protein
MSLAVAVSLDGIDEETPIEQSLLVKVGVDGIFTANC